MDHSFLSFAYIDIGTGSMLLQASLAGLFAVIVFSRQLRDRCKSYFKRGKKTLPNNE
mgnify:FL=1